jgi:hypothetical protein
MNLERWNKDSFLMGIIAGLVSSVIFYFILNAIRFAVINYYGNPYMLKPPTVQLLVMMVNVILFRLLMINLDKEKTAKGFLFVTVLVSLGYFYFLFK